MITASAGGPQKLRIAIIVPGRFEDFDAALALANLGHEVRVFTNYPRWAARRFGLPAAMVESCWIQGIAQRIFLLLNRRLGLPFPEKILTLWFSRWAARCVGRSKWHAIRTRSGCGLEVLSAPIPGNPARILIRGSSHIREQRRILEEEELRSGLRTDKPSDWIIGRECAEYAASDGVQVLSSFARDTFTRQGFPADKILLLPPGNPDRFRVDASARNARAERILKGGALTVLYAGLVNLRKGAYDLAAILRALPDSGRFCFNIAGQLGPESRCVKALRQNNVSLLGHLPAERLRQVMSASDVFIFPTLEDGFANILSQAGAAGLPVLTTPNSCGPDLICEGINGWVLPIRSPQAFVDRLLWCDAHRDDLARMARRTPQTETTRSWHRHAEELLSAISAIRLRKNS